MEKLEQIVVKEGSEALHKEFIERNGEVALEIVKLIGQHDKNVVGDIDDSHAMVYNDIVGKIVQLMIEKDIKFSEVDHIFELVMQPFEVIKSKVLFSNSMSFHKAIEAKFGKDRLDITLKELLDVVRQ